MSVVMHATAATVLPRRWSMSRISSEYNMFLTYPLSNKSFGVKCVLLGCPALPNTSVWEPED